MQKMIIALFLTLLISSPAFASLKVVATLPWVGSVAKEIGKDKIDVTTLLKSSQDPHLVEAKPSMILAGRKADILMYNGLDLEIGYLPLIMESAKNPKIAPGKRGNFDCSRFVNVIERHTAVDRSMGDVHPLGNPHYHFSPANVVRVAEGMANLLAEMDRGNADYYRRNFKTFAAKVQDKQKQWKAVNLKGKHYVAYHHYFEYLANDMGFRIVEYVEPKPGIPPSAAHIEQLEVDMKQNKPDGILVTPSNGLKESQALGSKTGVKVIAIPQDVGAVKGTDDYISFMDKVVAAFR